jgi:hypothetical protein
MYEDLVMMYSLTNGTDDNDKKYTYDIQLSLQDLALLSLFLLGFLSYS